MARPSRWPSEVRGDVLFIWRKELHVSRSALCRLLNVSYKLVMLNESEEMHQKEISYCTSWRQNYPDRQKESSRKWHQNNLLSARKGRLAYYYKNKETSLEKHRIWCSNNKEKCQLQNKRWLKEHPEQHREISHRRRARKAGAQGTCSAEQAVARIAFYGGMCAYCHVAPHEHLDHVIPLSRGGTNWPANLRPACARCNISKKDKFLSEWKGFNR